MTTMAGFLVSLIPSHVCTVYVANFSEVFVRLRRRLLIYD